MRISIGLLIVGGSMRRVIASRTMERQRAMRKTALKKAPRISALKYWSLLVCVYRRRRVYSLTPNEYLSEEDFCAAFTAQSPTSKEIISFNWRWSV